MWKDIANYEGLYKVNSIGEVYSIRTNKFINPTIRNNYLAVGLWKNGKVKMKSIHRLVAETFIPNPNNLPQVNHIDENKLNNRVENLEWCTAKYNLNYGTHTKKVVEKLTNGPLAKKVAQYDLDGNLIKVWDSIREIKRCLGYDNGTISKFCRNKVNWKHCYGFIWKYSNN